MTYIDFAATSPVNSLFLSEINKLSDSLYGNPSSNHEVGFLARKSIIESKDLILNTLLPNNSNNYDLIITSGSTESINTVFNMFSEVGNTLFITSDIEHKAVLKSVKKYETVKSCILPATDLYNVNNIDVVVNKVLTFIETHNVDTVLLSFTSVNNETGDILPTSTIQTIKNSIYSKYSNIKVFTHIDHTQGLCKILYDLSIANLVSFSGHKVGTFKGIGGLIISKDLIPTLQQHPLLVGGGQQDNMRSGTENALFINALSTLIKTYSSDLNVSESQKNMSEIKDILNQIATNCGVKIFYNNYTSNTSPYILNCSFEGIEGESVLSGVGLQNGCISTTSACNSNTLEPSYVLTKLGLPKEQINCAFRLSWDDLSVNYTKTFLQEEFSKVIKHLSRIRVRNIK